MWFNLLLLYLSRNLTRHMLVGFHNVFCLFNSWTSLFVFSRMVSPRVWACFRSFRRFWNFVRLFSKLSGWYFHGFFRLPIQLGFLLDCVEFSQIEIICCYNWLCIGWSYPVDLFFFEMIDHLLQQKVMSELLLINNKLLP